MGDDVSFAGRLSMYKPWGDSSGVQVFNGAATSMNIDGATTRVPNSDLLRVERAYFNWNNIADTSLYLSIGRRPSTGGPPLHLRDDELRAGTPLGTLIDFQFDGITAGYSLNEHSHLRLCYGLGYESGFGSAENLKSPADRLKDVHFLGVNWDLYDKDDTFVQATVARAFDVTDGFNGLVVMPVNPLTGMAVPAAHRHALQPVGQPGRHRPGQPAGHAAVGGGFDFFASYSYHEVAPRRGDHALRRPVLRPVRRARRSRTAPCSTPAPATTSPTRRPRSASSSTRASEYWFNFAQGADDVIAPKTAHPRPGRGSST